MPNGGSDCCGTCPFNEKNKGEAGYGHADDPDRNFCTIRTLRITTPPFYTYCANHPHHNPEGIGVPIGPVFEGDSDYNRWIVAASPDSPALREELIRLAERIPGKWTMGYPFGVTMAEAVVLQLGEWRAREALPALERIAGVENEDAPRPDGMGPLAQSPIFLVEAARRAIAEITDER